MNERTGERSFFLFFLFLILILLIEENIEDFYLKIIKIKRSQMLVSELERPPQLFEAMLLLLFFS